MIISVCGPLGFETAEKLYKENREMLEGRFAGFFLRQFEDIKAELVNESSFSKLTSDTRVIPIAEGGIYRALWEIGEELGCGMRVDNSAIPVRQEVIEILELFNESPYECSSRGSFLVVTDKVYSEITIAGNQIGITTDGKARTLEDGGNIRYLTPPARQEKDIADRTGHFMDASSSKNTGF